MMTVTRTRGEAAEWAEAVAVGPEVEVVTPAEGAAEAVAEANVIPRSRAPMARKFFSGSPKKRVDVSLKSLRRNPLARSTTVSSRNYAFSTAWAIHPIKTAQRQAIITSSWR